MMKLGGGLTSRAAALAAATAVQVALAACAERRNGDDRTPATSATWREPVTAVDSLLSGSTNGVIAYNSTVDSGIVLIDPGTGGKAWLTRGSSPEWFADGSGISFMRGGRIYVTEANGTKERELAIEPFVFEAPYMVRPVVSPAVRRLAYSRQGEIELADLSGGTPVFLMTPDPSDDRMPAWSPRGDQVAFVRDQDICVVNADGSGLRNLTHDRADNLDPEWSPSGDWIAFSSRRNGQARIWAMRVDGSDRRTVTRDSDGLDHQEHHPSWSPDGTQIVYERWAGQQGPQAADLYVVLVEGGTTRPLVEAQGFDGFPSWQRGSAISGSTRTAR